MWSKGSANKWANTANVANFEEKKSHSTFSQVYESASQKHEFSSEKYENFGFIQSATLCIFPQIVTLGSNS